MSGNVHLAMGVFLGLTVVRDADPDLVMDAMILGCAIVLVVFCQI